MVPGSSGSNGGRCYVQGQKIQQQKLPAVEDVNGRLSVSERSIPTIERKDKEADEYDRNKMGYSGQKGTWNNTAMPSGFGSV